MSVHSRRETAHNSSPPSTNAMPEPNHVTSVRNNSPHFMHVTSSLSLPSYDDIVPGSSHFSRRGSDSEMQMSSSRRKSFRTRSMRKKSRRPRPEITILSSQPMNYHPAFADGSKGSCVPPEAPPSYDEAVKESPAGSLSHNTPSYAGEINSGNIHGVATDRSAIVNLLDSPITFEASIDASSSCLLRPLSPEIAAPFENQRPQNNSNNTETSIPQSSSASSNRPAHLSTSVEQIQPIAQPRIKVRSSQSAARSNARPPLPVKPPVPRKPACARNNSSHQPPSISPRRTLAKSKMSTADSNTSPQVPSPRKAGPSPRKLPPPPRPPIASSMKLQPKVNGATSSSTVPSLSTKVQSNLDPVVTLNIDERFENTSDQKEADIKPDTSLEASKPSVEKTDESKNENSILPSTNAPMVPEPTYAVVKKQPSAKKRVTQAKPESKDDDHESAKQVIEKTVNDIPPPIPDTRPPIEDYLDLLQDNVASTSESTNDAAKEIADVFGAVHNATLPTQPSPVKRTTLKSSPIPHIKEENGSASDYEEIDDPYESVLSVNAIPADKPKQPPRPAVRPQAPPKSHVAPPLPPLPTDKRKSLYEKGDQAKPVVIRKHTNSKGLNAIKRKSMKLKDKSLKVLKSRRNSSDSDSAVLEKDKHTTVTDGSKSMQETTKGKRVPPPRPELPSVLQNKLQASKASTDVRSSLAPSSPSKRNSLPAKQPLSSKPSINANRTHLFARTPPPHPPPPAKSTAGPTISKRPLVDIPSPTSPLIDDKVIHEPMNSVSGHMPDDANNNPVPMPRHKQNQASSGSNSPEKVLHDSQPRVKNIPSKPSRPPQVRQPVSNKVVRKSVSSEEYESILDLVSTTDSNATVDQKTRCYLEGEIVSLAVQDHQPSSLADLSFSAGEKVLILKQVDDQLLFGRNVSGEEGTFPKNYVTTDANSNNSNKRRDVPVAKTRLNHRREAVIGTAKALHSYYSCNDDDLCFNAGDKIDVTEIIDSDWLKGKVGDSSGMFPRNYVSFTTNDKQKASASNEYPIATVLYDFNGMYDNELTAKAGDQIEVLRKVDNEWLRGRHNGKAGLIPLSFIKITHLNSDTEEELNLSPKGQKPLPINRNRGDEATSSSIPSSRIVIAQYGFKGEANGELSFPKEAEIDVLGETSF